MVALESEIALKVTEKRPLGGIDDLRGGGGLAGTGARPTAPAEEARHMPSRDWPWTGSATAM
jgi:hypothetical protein